MSEVSKVVWRYVYATTGAVRELQGEATGTYARCLQDLDDELGRYGEGCEAGCNAEPDDSIGCAAVTLGEVNRIAAIVYADVLRAKSEPAKAVELVMWTETRQVRVHAKRGMDVGGVQDGIFADFDAGFREDLGWEEAIALMGKLQSRMLAISTDFH